MCCATACLLICPLLICCCRVLMLLLVLACAGVNMGKRPHRLNLYQQSEWFYNHKPASPVNSVPQQFNWCAARQLVLAGQWYRFSTGIRAVRSAQLQCNQRPRRDLPFLGVVARIINLQLLTSARCLHRACHACSQSRGSLYACWRRSAGVQHTCQWTAGLLPTDAAATAAAACLQV